MAMLMMRAILICSAAGGLLTAVLLILKPVTQRVLGGRFQYYVWVLVLLALVLPVTLPAGLRLPPVLPAQALTPAVQPVGEFLQISPAQGEDTAHQPAPASLGIRLAPRHVILALWAVGALLLLGQRLWRYARFARLLRSSGVPVTCPEMERLAAEWGLRSTVVAMATPAIHTPLLMGVLRPVLFLPEQRLPDRALDHVLRHELTHYRRGDLWLKWAALPVLALHWFNPLAHLACRQMEEACEISCDLSVTAEMDGAERRGYMNTILSLMAAGGQGQTLTTAMAGEKEQIARRFNMIARKQKKSLWSTLSAWTVAAVLMGLTLLASGAMAYAADPPDTGSGIVVYNGSDRLTLRNKPFVEGGEIYLPLRETLDGLEPCEISWDNGLVRVTLPPLVGERDSQLFDIRLVVGDNRLILTHQNDYTIVMRGPVLLRGGVTYVTAELMEYIFDAGHIPSYRIVYDQSRDPADYAGHDEEVFIGTMAQQDAYNPVDENGAARLVKRVIVDEDGLVYSVATVENQQPQVVAQINGMSGLRVSQFKDIYWGAGYANSVNGARMIRVSGIIVERDGFSAYIPPACQVTSPWRQAFEGGQQG